MTRTHNIVKLIILVLLALAIAMLLLPTSSATTKTDTSSKIFTWYQDIVDIKFVKQYAVLPKRDDVLIIDARPKARKYDKGHIPSAVSIPERDFDKMTHLLPKDKDTLLIFYCGGEKCKLSHKSAAKAEKLGYKNIKVYAAGFPDWVKQGNMVSVDTPYVKKLLDTKLKVVVIDARPARKFKKGHIPNAINIPDTQFDKLSDRLPADKGTLLVFYCGGEKCKLSSNSAHKAKELGYHNIRTYTAGFPAWQKAYGKSSGNTKTVDIKGGQDEGTISISSFNEILKDDPGSILLIDVRDADEYKLATIKNAINIPINDFEKKVDTLPADKPIIFICGTGGRSGEAYDMAKLFRPELKVYFLDAELSFKSDGSYVATAHTT